MSYAQFMDRLNLVKAQRLVRKAFDAAEHAHRDFEDLNWDREQAFQDGADFYDADGVLIVSYPELVHGDFDTKGASAARSAFCAAYGQFFQFAADNIPALSEFFGKHRVIDARTGRVLVEGCSAAQIDCWFDHFGADWHRPRDVVEVKPELRPDYLRATAAPTRHVHYLVEAGAA